MRQARRATKRQRWLRTSLCSLAWSLLLSLQPHATAQKPRPRASPKAPTTPGSPAVPAATAEALRQLGARAAVIFVGRVAAVQRDDAAGYVDVVFHVEQAVRGASTGRDYVLREWAGLWTGSVQRYPLGKRLLLLLSARGPSGMSAPVGGMAGVIPLLATRQPPLLHGAAVPPPYTAEESTVAEAVDLRWVQSLVVRETTPPENTSGDASPRTSAHGDSGHDGAWRGPVSPMLRQRVGATSDGPGLASVLALFESRLAP